MIDSLSYLTPLMFYQIDVMWISGTVPTIPWCPRTQYGNKVFKPANTVFGTNGEWGNGKWVNSRRATLSCVQAALWMVQSISPSVHPSVCLSITHFSLCSHHRVTTKFSLVITNVRSGAHAKGPGQRSKVKVTEVNTQLSRFGTITLVWIHIWL